MKLSENFFANAAFCFLFLSMFSYWIQIAFRAKKVNIGRVAMLSANVCLFSFLMLRWKESGHFPLSNLYESLMFLSWSLSTFQLMLETIENDENTQNGFSRFFLNFSNQKNSFKQPIVGALTSPAALLINAFATFSLPMEMQRSSALVPALQSNWLMMHVTVMILSYAALLFGSLLSIAFLIFTRNDQINPPESLQNSNLMTSNLGTDEQRLTLSDQLAFSAKVSDMMYSENVSAFQQTTEMSLNKLKFAETLDNLSYRMLGIGFPFLTIGILSGAVWANEAWGSYWSWDPKETWALATWFVFAIYLHTRLIKGWSGRRPALIASFGFVIVWVCFLGVNLLGEGLHSYGFFK